MEWPQITVIVLWTVSVTFSIMNNGEPKVGRHSMWVTLAYIFIFATILRFGGFWS